MGIVERLDREILRRRDAEGDCLYLAPPDPLLTDAKAEIERLRAQLAGRDAEIAEWLREQAKVLREFKGASLAPSKFERTLGRIAAAIASGAYRKDTPHD